MFKPEFITFTGADDNTDIGDLLALAESHAVEFAILFSPSREGSARFPRQEWIEAVQRSGLRLAAHICGGWARQIVEEGRSEIDGRLKGFARVQINTAKAVDPGRIHSWAKSAGRQSGQQIEPILQCRGPFPDDPRVSWLYDPSGGRGISPASWPDIPGETVRFGYAGGLGPDNVAEVLAMLPEHEGGWIDMESRVRNGCDEFDTGLCRAVCEVVRSV
ncbi:hypothetical protein AB9K35_17885 [Leisingera sp. XS_AS12]|uniref:hypothetical protein n=1 Tax=Leisingera sp. XS_AS12 TaxID=3241294 RepID=UPI0035148469